MFEWQNILVYIISNISKDLLSLNFYEANINKKLLALNFYEAIVNSGTRDLPSLTITSQKFRARNLIVKYSYCVGDNIITINTLIQVSLLFERWRSLITSLINGALDSSSIILLFFKVYICCRTWFELTIGKLFMILFDDYTSQIWP